MIDSVRAGGAALLQLEIGDFIEADPWKGSFANSYILDRLEAEGPAAHVPGPTEISRWTEVRALLSGRQVYPVLSNVSLPAAPGGSAPVPTHLVLTVGRV